MKALLALILLSATSLAQQPASSAVSGEKPRSAEINTILMESTFFVQGPSSRPGENDRARFGAGFVMLRPATQEEKSWNFVLVTAKHVFEDIKGNTATLTLRRKNNAGDIEFFPWPVTIRENGKDLYVAHPTADVAVIDIALPYQSIIWDLRSSLTNINWLATDDFVTDIGLHPGDELTCLGFPLGIQPNGYPVLRSGKIASYPVTPLKKIGKIAYDFRVHPGNSGGPVYLAYSDRAYKNSLHLGTTFQKVFGIVVQQANPIENVDPSIGVIVPAVFIKETIDKLAGFESKIKEDEL